QNLRLRGQGPSDTDTLLLPAGQLGGMSPRFVLQPDQLQELPHTGAAGGPVDTGDLQRETDVSGHGPGGQQGEVLVHHAYVATSSTQTCAPKGGEILTGDLARSAVGTFQEVHRTQERALSSTAPAHDPEDLTGANAQVDPVQSGDPSLLQPVDLLQAHCVNHGHPIDVSVRAPQERVARRRASLSPGNHVRGGASSKSPLPNA